MKYLLSFVFAGIFSFSIAHASSLSWQTELDEESTWSRLTYAGTLLTASEKNLAHFDPETGELLWKRDDLSKLAQFNVQDVAGTGFLVISERLSNVPPKSRLQVVNLSTGETAWDTGEFAGSGLAAYAVPGQGLLVYVADLQDKDAGNYAVAYALQSGEEVWRTKLGRVGSLMTHPSDIGGFIKSPDLNGHPQPVINDGQMILAVGDLIAIDLETGQQQWRYKLKASIQQLKNTYAQPVVADGVVYAASQDSVHAIDAATGAEKWIAKVGKAQMPQLELVGNMLIGRMGGTFSNGKDLVQSKPFGVFAVDKTSGKLAWKWTKAKDSITNFRVHAGKGLVFLADKTKLYGLDINAKKKGNVVFEQNLEFKRKMGKADLAAKGMGAVGGLLSGGIGGGLKGLAGGGDRGDPPLDIDIVNEQLIVRAQYHVLSHNPANQSTDWSIEFAPPGMNSFALIAMGAVTATMAVANAQGSWSTTGATSQAYADSALLVTGAFQNSVAKRFAAAEKARTTAFFLTKEDDEIVLLGIDLADGGEVGRIPMDEKEPQFMVDAVGNRVYYFRNKTELLAYDF
jgi:outer membrane protein assembly factor BamB